jgi:hypothetical protein
MIERYQKSTTLPQHPGLKVNGQGFVIERDMFI